VGVVRYADEMRRFPLELRVRTPCDVPSDQLVDAREGSYCLSCEKIVHDLSRLTFDEAADLFAEARRQGARVCADMLVRSTDGAVLFADGYALPPSSKRRLPLAANALAAAGTVMLAACADAPQVVVPELPRAPVASPAPQPTEPVEPVAPPASPRFAAPPPGAPPSPEEPEPIASAPAPQAVSPAVAKGHAPAKANPKGKKPDHRQMRGDIAM
jgi:hypothetical protein